jgi:hypothetical protein
MIELSLIQQLKATLEQERLHAVEALAAQGADISVEALERLATLQSAITAVSEEIDAHRIRLGGGDERPL